ncbi:MAG: hypothetical protein WC995_03560, partial [Lysobacteraceae bacterium]
NQEWTAMTVKRAFPIRQGYGTGLIGSVLMAGLVLVAPVAMGSEAGRLVLRGEAGIDPGTVSRNGRQACHS